MATFNGNNDDNVLMGSDEDDVFNGFGGNDTITGGAGNDTAIFNVTTDGADAVNLGEGSDVVNVSAAAAGQVRLTFTSSEVGNGSVNDSNSMLNQDGGLAVRLQAEDAGGTPTGPVSRYDDEGISFVAGDGVTFDVRDLVSGVQRGDQFEVATLGTNAGDTLIAVQPTRSYYFNAGMGDDTVTGGTANDFLVGGAGADTLTDDVGNDSFIGGGGNDTITGGAGNDTAIFNVTTDGADAVNLGEGSDVVTVAAAMPGQVRLTFTSAQVGNGNVNDSNSMLNQDGGLAVRLQAEDAGGTPTGPVSRYDDEGISFVAGAGVTFDVRDLVSGVERGDQFEVATLGTSGNDTLTAVQPTRSYYFNAGMGDDTVTGGTANDFLVGGAGADTLTDDVGNDSFIGGGGNDTITAGAGNDTAIFNVTTDGADAVNLGEGSDVVTVAAAMPGQVRLTFTSAQVGNGNVNDSNSMLNQDGGLAVRLQAEDAGGTPTGPVSRYDDEGISFVAGAGVTFDVRDLVSGVERGDQFEVATLGTSGNDTLTAVQPTRSYYFNAGMGDDTVTGGTANDFLVGGAGADTLTDDVGNDSFIGGGGNDTITAGAGNDTAIFNVTTDGADAVNLGEGSDVVTVAAAMPGQVRLTFTSAQVGNGNVNDSNSMLNQDGGLAVRLQAEDAGGTPTGPVSRYDDEGISFVAGAGVTFDVRDLVSGVERGDQFEVATLGTSGNDTLTAVQPTRSYYFNAGMGDDTVTGGTANDFLVGGAGADTLTDDVGNDSFIGGGGNDTITAGAGNDTAIFNVTTDGADAVNLGEGSDVVTVAAAMPGQVRLTFTSAQVGNGNVNDSNSMLNQDGGLAVRLQAEDAGGTPTGPVSRYDDEGISFVAGAGVTFDVRDLVSGVERGDQFEVATLGTSGNDILTAVQPTRSYYFNAGMGDDTVTGGTANDFLVGGAGNDTLTDDVGNDSFIGGGGNDTITAGAGNDTAIFNVTTDGADAVNLGEGSDVVTVAAAMPGQVRLTFTSAQVGNGNVNDSNSMLNQDGGLAVRLQAEDAGGTPTGPVSRYDDEGISFVAGAGVTFDVRDLVSGVERGDQFEVATLGTSGNDILTAVQPTRSYYINAGMGNDTVTGGTANDFLVGGAGNDRFEGGGGNDQYIGGAGRDRFDYEVGADTGSDTIIDFMKVDLFVSDARLQDRNNDGRIEFGANGALDLGAGDTVAFTGLDPASGLRFLGQLDDGGFAYADAATRPMGATEGTLADNVLTGNAGVQRYFFDTALGLDFGDDRITSFGTEDLLVTTSAIFDGNGDGRIDFGDDRILDLTDGTSVRINDRAVSTLEFDGSVTQNGAEYFVYSRLGSTSTGTDDLLA